MKKYFTFSDVHGNFTALDQSLKNAGFDANNEDHVLLGLGDYFDRGSQSKEVYEFLKSFEKLGRGFYGFGNHDEMFYDYLKGGDGSFNFEYNGLWETVKSFTNLRGPYYLLDEEAREKINKNYGVKNWLAKLPLGFKIGDYIFTHAGLKYDIVKDSWVIDVWAKTPDFVKDFIEKPEWTFLMGHWHCSKLNQIFNKNNSNSIFQYKNFIGLDACTNLTKFVNIFIYETDKNIEFLNYEFVIKAIGI